MVPEAEAPDRLCPIMSQVRGEPQRCIVGACMAWRWQWHTIQTKASDRSPAGRGYVETKIRQELGDAEPMQYWQRKEGWCGACGEDTEDARRWLPT